VSTFRTVVPVVAASWLAVFAFGLSACKRVETIDAPDANVPCNAGAHVFCAPDASVGCGTSDEPDKRIAQLPPGVYATGCVANFVSADKDLGGDCIVTAICRCNEGIDGGSDASVGPHWTCFP
jgi:hypothetical protein